MKSLVSGFFCLLSAAILGIIGSYAQGDGNSPTPPSVPIVHVQFGPDHPVAGQSVDAFITVETGFTSSDPVGFSVEAKLDPAGEDSPSLTLLHPQNGAWIAQLGKFDAISTHHLEVSSYLIDTSEVQKDNNQILQLESANSALSEQIAALGDSAPDQVAQLKAEIQQNNTAIARLQNDIEANTKPLTTDAFEFSIGPNTASTTDPQITDIEPGFGSFTGGESVQIIGKNFASNSEVFIGGHQANGVELLSSGNLQFTQPPIGVTGAFDVEVRNPGAGLDYTNAILKHGFYIIAGAGDGSPVAYAQVASGSPNPASIHSTVQLDGSGSYGFTSNPLTYEWSLTGPGTPALTGATTATPSFSADQVGIYVATLVVSDGISTSLPSTVVITVNQPAAIAIQPSTLSFAARTCTSTCSSPTPCNPQTVPVTITNISNVDSLTVTGVSVAGNDGEFSVGPLSPVGGVLKPGQSASVNVTYTPNIKVSTSQGTAVRDGLFTLATTWSATSGSNTYPTPIDTTTYPAQTLQFFQRDMGYDGNPQTVSFTQPNQAMELPEILDASSTTNLTVYNCSKTDSVVLPSQGPILTADTVGPVVGSIKVNSAWPTPAPTLAPQGAYTIPLEADPANPASQSEGLFESQLAWNYGIQGVDQPLQIQLMGIRTEELGQLIQNPLDLGTVIAGSSVSKPNFILQLGDPAQFGGMVIPNLGWLFHATNVVFPVGSSGFSASALSTPFDFGYIPGGDSVDRVPVTVTFNAAGLNPSTNQTVTADLDVFLEGFSSPFQIPVSVTVLPGQPTLAANLSVIDFKNVSVGGSMQETVTLSNTGTSTANISSITASGRGFSATPISPSSIPPLGTGTFMVSFTPTSAAAASGTLTIASNASNSTMTIALKGQGVQPQISVSPTKLSLALGGQSSIVVSDSGNAPLSVSGVGFAEGNSGGFQISGFNGPITVQPGTPLTLLVTAPSQKAAAELIISSNDANSPTTTVSLSAGAPELQNDPMAYPFEQSEQDLNSSAVPIVETQFQQNQEISQ